MMKVQLLSLAGVLVLSFTAEKCRQLVGEDHSSRSRTERFTFINCFDMRYGTIACIFKEMIKLYLYYVRAVHVQKVRGQVSRKALLDRSRTERFTFINCFDMRYGTIACIFKEMIKLYLYYVRAVHVQKVRGQVSRKALLDRLSKDQNMDQAVKAACEEGKAAAKRASRQAKHVMGPIVASGWDLFETLYVGGSLVEGLVRSGGTFLGAFAGGLVGEGKIGWLGFVLGSQMGSWTGGRIALMAYDVGIGLQYLLYKMPFLS
ncbi:unnamed protein product [Fraxinus pennsylvanica]|uniref:Uncharacterized protein n=1 Tax=Fraxinus pennsylvanica TaxID=56036 RepID=A0AAD2A3N6_9LAMI|nr:unnamed protein product [Fraxinus pennsylvanica]